MNITVKMIEAQTPQNTEVVKESKATISISKILQDLEDGLGREKIAEKYSIQNWEVTELFKHPKLKGKKAKKKKTLSFQIVDDTETQEEPTLAAMEETIPEGTVTEEIIPEETITDETGQWEDNNLSLTPVNN